MIYYKELLCIYKVLLILNQYGDPPFLFQNLSSSKINNQEGNFVKISVQVLFRRNEPGK